MDIIKFSIHKPVTVIVGIILVIMFGIIGLLSMPYQLSPTVTEPEITITTIWIGATPYEIERDIIEEQEKVLKGIPGLVQMESSSYNSQGQITLRFKIGTDVDNALLRVSNKLDEVPSYPENVEKPTLNATGAATSPVIWMVFKSEKDNQRSIYTYRTYFENDIRQYLERVEGVADLFVRGGTENEMHVIIDPEKMSSYGLTVNEVINVLRTENRNVSAGTMGVGRKEYRIRTVADFDSPEEIANTVIRSTGQQRIFISDVATVQYGYAKLVDAMMHMGDPGIAVGIQPQPGSNILDLTDRVEAVVQWLNEEKLRPKKVYLEWVYDQRPYIRGAIDLLKRNIAIGGGLAIVVLIIFLRSLSSTIVAASSIPISIIGTFILMNALGRNLNVVSLAGIAFAVGMLVDSAIVVLENIDRHRKMGKLPADASYDGTREVWGAILASTLTTIAVFLPVVFIKEEAGQLFRDIAIAVTCAITLSLFVAVSVIPMLTKQFYVLAGKRKELERSSAGSLRRITSAVKRILKYITDLLGGLGANISERIMNLVSIGIRTWYTRIITIGGLTLIAIVSTVLLFPKMEYLPQGNRNLVINILIPPPGLSYDERKEVGEIITEAARPYFDGDHNGVPGIKNLFYVGSTSFMLFGATSIHDDRAGDLIPLFTRTIYSIPGMFGVSQQAGIFQTRLGRGRTIEVDISGDYLDQVIKVGGTMFGMVMKEIQGSQVRPVPSLEVLFPEIRFMPRRDRLRASGMSSSDLGVTLDVMMDGRDIGDFKKEGEKKIDLIIKSSEQEIATPEKLIEALIVTPEGDIVPVSSLTDVIRTTGINEIRHLERQRTVTLQVTPPFTITLQEAMENIETKIIPALKNMGMLEDVSISTSGAADKLTETRKALQWNFLMAVVIAYLLMSALFGNFLYPFIILFTVPLASAGGFVGLRLVNLLIAPSPLDILTMLGFIILVGVVVNNAILIVHQALNNVRYNNMDYREAVLESTRTRLRPIYMSATTSIFAMLPLVIVPGPGAELYRGLGSVILGGIALSTIFTVFVIPPLLMFAITMEKRGGNE
jgi:HAE1 family hydrophobic/amphiphilic exporter-1